MVFYTWTVAGCVCLYACKWIRLILPGRFGCAAICLFCCVVVYKMVVSCFGLCGC